MGDVVSKQTVRQIVYRRLREQGAARFPFPIEGRIPNFKGAESAAARLRQHPLYRAARAVKVNPDAPQLPVRAMLLADGKTLYMPAPRLRGAFVRIRPEDVEGGEFRKAVSLKHCGEYGEEVPLTALAADSADRPTVDLIVTGSVAVTRRGARAGKGEGYGDLEYAILRELGHPPIPVVTTVHRAQIVEAIPVERHDLSLDVIATPDEVITTGTPHGKPDGVDWDRLTNEHIEAMPVLAELRRVRWESFTVDDLLAPDLYVLFVGLNPGRVSAGSGHHFAGPGNHFWKLLYEAGFTPRRLRPDEEGALPGYGVGITNVVARASRGEGDLSWDELQRGAAVLRENVFRFRPKVVALLGKQVARAYAELNKGAAVSWGVQERETVPGVRELVAPNPSSRSTVPYDTRLACFQEAYRLVRDVIER